MRSFFDKGVRPSTYAHMLLEWHSIEHLTTALQPELYNAPAQALNLKQLPEMFSNFHDDEKYNGAVPTAGFLEMVNKNHHSDIKKHMERETKARSRANVYGCVVQGSEAPCSVQWRGSL